jgi:hypothetical protein
MGVTTSSYPQILAAEGDVPVGPRPSNAQCATDAQCGSNECCVHNLCTSAPEVCPKSASASIDKYPCASFAGVVGRDACQARCGNDAQCDFACRTCNGENLDVPAGWQWLSRTRASAEMMTPAQYYASWATAPVAGTIADDAGLPYVALNMPTGAPDAQF